DYPRAVKAPPALLPVVGDLGRRDLYQRVARGRPQLRQAGQLSRRAVDGVLDMLTGVGLLNAAGGQLEQLGEHQLRLVAPDAHSQTDHAPWPAATRLTRPGCRAPVAAWRRSIRPSAGSRGRACC